MIPLCGTLFWEITLLAPSVFYAIPDEKPYTLPEIALGNQQRGQVRQNATAFYTRACRMRKRPW
jgi:hypothetical protein